MATLNMDQAFPKPTAVKRTRQAKRNYDVKLTINLGGHDGSGKKKKPVIRFGLINQASQIFGAHPFIEVSDVEYTKDRIYFRAHEEKIHRRTYSLSKSSSDKSRKECCYFAMTPSEKAEKIYRMNWIGKACKLLYDEENELYYIENTKD